MGYPGDPPDVSAYTYSQDGCEDVWYFLHMGWPGIRIYTQSQLNPDVGSIPRNLMFFKEGTSVKLVQWLMIPAYFLGRHTVTYQHLSTWPVQVMKAIHIFVLPFETIKSPKSSPSPDLVENHKWPQVTCHVSA